MKKIKTFSILLACFLLISSSWAASRPPAKGGVLPVIDLPIPKNEGERNYLGLSGSGLFKIPQIKAKLVVVEIFSFYCPYCQKDAPKVNALYDLIESSSELKNKIKLIGLGAGNSPFEVATYKKTYQVPFPLFSDKDFTIHKACGEVRTPYFIAVKISEDGTHQIVHTQLGDFPGAKPFLDLILNAAGPL